MTTPKTPPPITLLDGGLGTLLTSPPHNKTFTTAHPLWSSHLLISPSDQAILGAAQKQFVDAGADVLLSATYQASFAGFEGTRVDQTRSDGEGGNREDGGNQRGDGIGEDEAGRYMRGGVEIARSCFDSDREGGNNEGKRRGRISLSLGAYGATTIPGTEYSGLYDASHTSISQLRDWHLDRLHVFLPSPSDNSDAKLLEEKTRCWEDVDMIAFETLPTRNEILAVRHVMSSVPEERQKPFWIACVFPGEENCLPDGSEVREVVEGMIGTSDDSILKEEDVKGKGRVPDGIGINCTKVSKLDSLILEFENATKEILEREGRGEWPSLVVYPDGTKGEVYNTTTKEWEMVGKRECEDPWDETVFRIVMGARERGFWKDIFVGGCCKSTPEDIGKLRRRIDEL